MKKTNVKKLIALISAALVCLAIPGISAIAAMPESGISPQNIAIVAMDNNLTMDTDGVLTCYGATDVQNGYNAGVVVKLQQFNGSSWSTIKTWSVYGADWAVIDKDYEVDKGYAYQLELTHTSYDSNWVELESFDRSSNTIGYY